MRETLTSLLDFLALLLLALGIGALVGGGAATALDMVFGLPTVVIGLGMFVAGVVVFAGSLLASRPPKPSLREDAP